MKSIMSMFAAPNTDGVTDLTGFYGADAEGGDEMSDGSFVLEPEKRAPMEIIGFKKGAKADGTKPRFEVKVKFLEGSKNKGREFTWFYNLPPAKEFSLRRTRWFINIIKAANEKNQCIEAEQIGKRFRADITNEMGKETTNPMTGEKVEARVQSRISGETVF